MHREPMDDVTRSKSAGVRLEPEGRQRPFWKRDSATEPPMVSQPWKMGLQVHGFPDWAGLNVCGFQGQADAGQSRTGVGIG